MKKHSGKKKIKNKNGKLIFENKKQTFNDSKYVMGTEEKKSDLSAVALMKQRIEEMHRKLSEKRNQRK